VSYLDSKAAIQHNKRKHVKWVLVQDHKTVSNHLGKCIWHLDPT
jgi:hypothetical protein